MTPPCLKCTSQEFVFDDLCFNEGMAMEKDGRSSAMSEGEPLDEEDDDDDDEEGAADTEEQSGNESEMNEQEEDVSPFCCSGHVSVFTSLVGPS